MSASEVQAPNATSDHGGYCMDDALPQKSHCFASDTMQLADQFMRVYQCMCVLFFRSPLIYDICVHCTMNNNRTT